MPAHPLKAAFAGILLFVIGLAMAGGVYQVNSQERERLRGWRRADGTVVELLKRPSPEGGALVPLIAFTTAGGERVSFTTNAGAKASPFYVTAPVKVMYHPGHPEDATIDTSSRRWTRNVLAGGAALILLGIGGYVAWYSSRWDNRAEPAG